MQTPARIGVVGAGTMGSGIAQVAILAGIETVLHDPLTDALDAAQEAMSRLLAKGAAHGRWTEAKARAAQQHLHTTPALRGLEDCDLVIEAAPELPHVKRTLFSELSKTCGPRTILATNTSSIPVTQIAAAACRPENVVGMHFFNPAPLMKLVEVVSALQTGKRARTVAGMTADAMGKQVIEAADAPGFLVNRCARPFFTESLRILQERLATPEHIDWIFRVGAGFRMGPFETMDLVGLDVNLAVAQSFTTLSFGEPRWKPSRLQAQMVAAGRLGRKSGRGWYVYPTKGPHRAADDPAARLSHADAALLQRLQCCIVNEAAFALGEGIGSTDDIDAGMKFGLNWPKGPLEVGRELGFDRVLTELDRLCDHYREERYRAAPLLRSSRLS